MAAAKRKGGRKRKPVVLEGIDTPSTEAAPEPADETGFTIGELPPSTATPEPEVVDPPLGDSTSFNAFAGDVSDEQRHPDAASSGMDGIEIEGQSPANEPDESPEPKPSAKPSDDADVDAPRPKRKRKDDNGAPHTTEEYEEFASNASHVVDVVAGMAARSKLRKHVTNQTLHPETLERFIESLDLTSRERRKLSKVSASVLEKEQVKIDPMYNLFAVAAALALPRIQAVTQLDDHLTRSKAEGLTIAKDEQMVFRHKSDLDD